MILSVIKTLMEFEDIKKIYNTDTTPFKSLLDKNFKSQRALQASKTVNSFDL